MPEVLLSDLQFSADSTCFAGSPAKGCLVIWRTDSPIPQASLIIPETGRYALDPGHHRIFAGTWEHGLYCFDVPSGCLLWHRLDLAGIGHVRVSPAFPGSVFITTSIDDWRIDEPGGFTGVMELDGTDGKSIWKAAGVGNVFLHPDKPVILAEDEVKEKLLLLDKRRKKMAVIPKLNFGLLDVAFQSDLFATAEGERGLRLINNRGKVMLSYLPPSRESNFLALSFSGDELFYFDSWERNFVGRLNVETGKLLSEYEVPEPRDICFAHSGRLFVSSQGRVCRTSDGSEIFRLHFPDGLHPAQLT
jgi:outer membrane protein assembly factor BamB